MPEPLREPLREQIRTALAARVQTWVTSRALSAEIDESLALAQLAELAGIGGAKPSVRASNLRRALDGRSGISYELADAIARAVGAQLSIFLEDRVDP